MPRPQPGGATSATDPRCASGEFHVDRASKMVATGEIHGLSVALNRGGSSRRRRTTKLEDRQKGGGEDWRRTGGGGVEGTNHHR
ncbi:hypothetical protein KM043_012130 [Ampulex compressa]|nr:hypothetical protein KM043_012130 [Ampulex compressa]